MSELIGFPMVNQLDMSETIDGRLPENRLFDCVPASICAGLEYFNGITYYPDTLKDQAYGEAWANQGTAATAFVPYCLSQGIALSKITCPSGTAAISVAHQELAKGHPVIFTQQDDYAPAHPDWTHVCVWYKDTPGTLTCMDPFGGKALTFDNLTWAARLRENAVWIMEKITTMKFDADGWLDAAIEIDAIDKSMSRNGWKPLIIMIHGTAGFQTAQDVGHYFASLDPNASNAASTHFVIGKDGAIVQCVNVDVAAWGNGGLTAGHKPFLPAGVNPNFYTVSIEHVKNHKNAQGVYDNMDPVDGAQYQASFHLIDVLCKTYSIPRKMATDMTGGILGHWDSDPVNKPDCPGPFPWNTLIADLNGGSKPVATFDQMVIDLWNSQAAYFKALGQDLPPRDTGIFKAWRQELVNGHFRGVVLSAEYKTVDANGHPVIAQNYGDGVCHYTSGIATWL